MLLNKPSYIILVGCSVEVTDCNQALKPLLHIDVFKAAVHIRVVSILHHIKFVIGYRK